MSRRFAAVLVLFGLSMTSANSADRPPDVTLPVGANEFRGEKIVPYENVWRYTATLPSGETKIQGLWSDRMDRIDKDGRKLMRRVQGMTYVNGLTSSTINVFDPLTMAAVSSEVHRVDGSWLKRSFSGTKVTETRGASPSDKTGVTTMVTLPQPVFDYWGGMYGMLLAGLQLKPGMSGTLPSIAEFDPDYITASFRVLRSEDLVAGMLGPVHTTVVESEGATYWISASAPYIIKLSIPMPGGAIANWSEI